MRYRPAPTGRGGMLDPWTNADVADERVRGLLIKRRRPFEAVALLEAKERPPCLGAGYAVERTVVEPYHVKLYLHPPDVVFRRICGIQPLVRRFKVLITTSSASAEKSTAAPPIP